MFKTILNGVLEQDKDNQTETADQFKTVTQKVPTESEIRSLEFALKVCKHTKSNTIVLAKEAGPSYGQLLASGVGQTSRVDALRQAIEKAHAFWIRPGRSRYGVGRFLPLPGLCRDCAAGGDNGGSTTGRAPSGIRTRLITATSMVWQW